MPGTYIAAGIAIAIAFVVVLSMVRRIEARHIPAAILGVLASAAAFFGAFHLVRLPLDSMLRGLLENHPGWYGITATFHAPLTEEPAKWLVLIPLFLAGRIRPERKNAWGAGLGFGFGMGEIVFLAQRIAADPGARSVPWYLSGGFIAERLMVCTIHGALVLVALDALLSGKYRRMAVPVLLHWLVNLPIFISRRFPLDAEGIVWGQLLWIWIGVFFIWAAIYLAYPALSNSERMAAVLGKAVCPECGTLYVRPFFGVNRIGKRYERCPNCKNRHWTTLYAEKRPES